MCFLKLDNVLFQALWFLSIVSRHCAFSRTLVFQPCFSTLWFFKDYDFLALFFQHCVFSNMVFFKLYSQCCTLCFFLSFPCNLMLLCFAFCVCASFLALLQALCSPLFFGLCFYVTTLTLGLRLR
jgi:hypothetical protein